MDYAHIDSLAVQFMRAADQPAFLAEVWGVLTSAEGRRLLEAIAEIESTLEQ